MDLRLGLLLGVFTRAIASVIGGNKEFQDSALFEFQDGTQYEFN